MAVSQNTGRLKKKKQLNMVRLGKHKEKNSFDAKYLGKGGAGSEDTGRRRGFWWREGRWDWTSDKGGGLYEFNVIGGIWMRERATVNWYARDLYTQLKKVIGSGGIGHQYPSRSRSEAKENAP